MRLYWTIHPGKEGKPPSVVLTLELSYGAAVGPIEIRADGSDSSGIWLMKQFSQNSVDAAIAMLVSDTTTAGRGMLALLRQHRDELVADELRRQKAAIEREIDFLRRKLKVVEARLAQQDRPK